MRLAEHTLFVRLLTREDVATTGVLAAWCDELDVWAAPRWVGVLDRVEVRGEERPVGGATRGAFDDVLGSACNLRYRRVLRAEDGFVRSLDLHASSHPYSGAHVTWLDLRLHRDAIPAGHDPLELDTWFTRTVTGLSPLWAHMHDRDDDAIQNCDSPSLLRLGFGVEVDTIDLASNPGREWNRGEVRLAANWRTWYADEVVDRLRPFAHPEWLERGSALAGGKLWSLPGSALAPTDRDAQRLLRDGLGLPEAAAKDRWTLGFWQRKG
jgi:hypothetical protein